MTTTCLMIIRYDNYVDHVSPTGLSPVFPLYVYNFSMPMFQSFLRLVFLALSVPRFPCLVLLKLFGPASEILQRSPFSPCLIPTISPFQAFQMWTLFVSFIFLSCLSRSRSLPQNGNPNTSNQARSYAPHTTIP